tara:strand:- start:11541 stop:12368 length:828 start_codon:yes stop_codon:yes gene_type:complete
MYIIKLLLLVVLNAESYILPNISPNILNNKKNRLNKRILLSVIKKENNETSNTTWYNNIKSIEYSDKEDMWIIDLKLPESEESKSEESSEFPSFNKFIEERKKEEEIKSLYFGKIEKTKHIESKDLKLISYSETINFSKKWIYDMINHGPSDSYPKFIYDNIYDIREYCTINIERKYFYIGYYPKGSIIGPYYIGAFELNAKTRELNTNLIMQNPNYVLLDKGKDKDKDKDKDRFINFKKELIRMSHKANIDFKYDKLKNVKTCERYYYSWLYEG